MAVIHDKVQAFMRRHGSDALSVHTGLPIEFLQKLLRNRRGKSKFMRQKIDILYNFFHLPHDPWYNENMKRWVMPTESILGDIFRKKRISNGMTIDDVANRTGIGQRQIARIEAGDSMPGCTSYTMTQLISLYDFSEEESTKIRWFIAILRDLITISNKLG